MAVFRIERTKNYTVMSNYHLRDKALSLKSKGLLSMMLSLPEDWNYTTRGLAKICKEGVDAIGGALRELESAGYIVRHQMRDRQGRICDTEYVIYEQPQPKAPDTPQPDTASPDTENPYLDDPDSLNYQKLGKELMSQDELAVMDGSKCILQLRGVRPFLSDKYDITQHPNYKYTADADPKNAFDIEGYLKARLKLKPNQICDVYEIDAAAGD